MRSERRHSGIHDRREPWKNNQQHSETADLREAKTAGNVMSAPANEDAVSTREKLGSLRQKMTHLSEKRADLRQQAISEREARADVQEDRIYAREAEVVRREDLASLREQENRSARTLNMAQDDFNSKLKQANEHLVVVSIQLQVMAEELERSKLQMTHLALHDFLTNLPNRMRIYDRIGQAIASAKRHDTKLAVMFLDLDRFKVVNDSLGHAIGDQLLQSVAQRLTSAIRESDTVSRYGGDEFVLLLPDVNSVENLTRKIEQLHDIVTAPYCVAGNDLDIGATIGISLFPKDGDDAETLIRHADSAMYSGKKNGRNKYRFFRSDMPLHEVERAGIEKLLHQALEKQEFVLFYQAQVSLESGAITGAEALIRWRHPSRGLLLPASFVPDAENCGAIVPIGGWVLREACRQAKSWLDAGLDFNVIAVNISAREFDNTDFLKNVRSVLEETGLESSRLEIELTETALMKSIESTSATLHALRSMGVRISIDDFGTGQSSLSYLKRFPVDTMKIDQSFVRDISNGADDILVIAIIGIGHSLHHHVIAEGVETAEQLAFLRENHCSAVQGYYLNIPMAADEFAAVLEQGIPAGVLN